MRKQKALTLTCPGQIHYLVERILQQETVSQAGYLRGILYRDLQDRGILDKRNRIREDVIQQLLSEGIILISDKIEEQDNI